MKQAAQPAPKIRAAETSAAPFVVIMPEEPTENIKLWYSSQYPSDERGENLNPEMTFENAFDALKNGVEWYGFSGAADSVVRERIFEALASVFECDCKVIYTLWIDYPSPNYNPI